MSTELTGRPRSTGLVDVLDRVLDKGLVIAGDVKVSLAEVELLTIRIRLIVCSLDKAESIGLDWWKHDHHLAPGRASALVAENAELRQQLAALEAKVAALGPPVKTARPARKRRDGGARASRRDPEKEQVRNGR